MDRELAGGEPTWWLGCVIGTPCWFLLGLTSQDELVHTLMFNCHSSPLSISPLFLSLPFPSILTLSVPLLFLSLLLSSSSLPHSLPLPSNLTPSPSFPSLPLSLFPSVHPHLLFLPSILPSLPPLPPPPTPYSLPPLLLSLLSSPLPPSLPPGSVLASCPTT